MALPAHSRSHPDHRPAAAAGAAATGRAPGAPARGVIIGIGLALACFWLPAAALAWRLIG